MTAAPSKVALLVHKGIVKLVENLRQTLASLPPASKQAEKKYYIPTKGFKYLYIDLSQGSLVVTAANIRDRWGM